MSKSVRLVLAAIVVAGASTTAFAQGGPKYRDTGVKPATGRSGSATLEARVLIAKQGSMTIEASTAGTLARVQIKAGALTQNHNGLNGGGAFATTLPAVPRGTAVQVQANIRDVDPHRTDVVTVTAPAALRPDLAVMSLSGPARQMPGAPVTFIAVVQEKNGDVGAHTDCSLSINDTVAATTPAIWVDAGGTVSCQFTHTFAAPGTYTVSAAAANVRPGDWDTANNSAPATIVIAEPGTSIASGSIDVEQRNTTERYLESRAGSYYVDRTTTRNYTFVTFNGAMAVGSAPIQSVKVGLFGNGNLQHHASLAPSWWTTIDFPNFRGVCGHYNNEFWDGARWVYSRDLFTACSYTVGGGTEPTHSQFFYQQLAGDVVYRETGSYDWIDAASYGGAADMRWTAGTSVRLKLDFIDANGATFTADRTVTLIDQSSEVNADSSGIWEDDENGDVVWEQRVWGVLFRGVVIWQ